MLLSAGILGADAVILDLEDAVAINQKDSARILVREAISALDFGTVEVMVRINPVSSPYWTQDLDEIIPVMPDAIMIPKATSQDVVTIENYVKAIETQLCLSKKVKFVLIAESAYGVEMITDTLRASSRIDGVLLGAEDLATDLEVVRTKQGREIEYARGKIVMACRAFGVQAIDTPFTDVEDETGLRADTMHAKTLGFHAKALINPRQANIVHEVMSPSKEDIMYASAIMEAQTRALEEGIGVFSYQGKMVDQPIVLRAQKILDAAERLGLI